ncbi:MAG: PcfJ domain-containing protein [Thermonemataceae bacterium]
MGNLHKTKKVPLYIKKEKSLSIRREKEQAYIQTLKIPKRVEKVFLKNIELIFAGKAYQASPVFEQIEKDYKALKKLTNCKEQYVLLLKTLYKKRCTALLESKPYVAALKHLAEHSAVFVRSVNTWQRKSHNVEKQFTSLVEHLFARYKTPKFLVTAWLGDQAHYRAWYINIAQGMSVRKQPSLPFVMTKKMAKYFLQTPDYYTIPEALRYAQVLGLGGNKRLVKYINGSYLGRNNFEEEYFWSQMIQFFVKAGMFDYERVEEIVDYVREERRTNQNYSLKGRTINALLRQTQAWHEEMNRRWNRGGTYIWKTCGIEGFGLEEGTLQPPKTYWIRELLSSKELQMEGKKHNHCVASYALGCYQKRCAIYSLYVEEFACETSLITIEVSLVDKTIVQARGKYNRSMKPNERRIVALWAAQEALTISKWV